MLGSNKKIQKCNIRPIGDRVFVIRDPDEDELMGMKVGDRAVVKSLRGTVCAVGPKCKTVKCGMIIHLPHGMASIEDCVIDGLEMACVQESDLFAIEDNGEFQPINRYIRVRKCTNDHIRDESGAIALFMTDNHIEETNWCEIIEVAPECEWVSNKYRGYFLVAPESDDKLQRILRTKDWCVHESLIKFITDGE